MKKNQTKTPTKEQIQKDIDSLIPLLSMYDVSELDKKDAQEGIDDLNAELKLREHKSEVEEARQFANEPIKVTETIAQKKPYFDYNEEERNIF